MASELEMLGLSGVLGDTRDAIDKFNAMAALVFAEFEDYISDNKTD